MEKIYYSPKGYWKGIAAIKKLADAAEVSENVSENWLKNKQCGRSTFQLLATFQDLNLMYLFRMRFTKLTSYFYHTIV